MIWMLCMVVIVVVCVRVPALPYLVARVLGGCLFIGIYVVNAIIKLCYEIELPSIPEKIKKLW